MKINEVHKKSRNRDFFYELDYKQIRSVISLSRNEKTTWGGGFFEGSVSWGTSEPW